jgi:WD40 repeat protein
MGPNTKIKQEINQQGIINKGINTGGGNFFGGDIVNNNTFITYESEQLKIEDIPQKLKAGAQRYYEQVTSAEGRFGHLQIEDESRKPLHERLLAQVKGPGSSEPKPLPEQLDGSAKDLLLLGDSGMGKTFSLLWMWKTYLAREDCMPIFIPLDRYNRVSQEVKEQFITHYIATAYLGYQNLDDQTANTLWKWLNGETDEDKARLPIILLLDGLDEITTDINPLLIDLDESWVKLSQGKTDRIIVSSRFKSNHRFAEKFESLNIQQLSDKRIRESLANPSDFDAFNTGLQDLLKTPMMLTLYLSIEQDRNTHLSNITDLIAIYLARQFQRFKEQQEKEDTQLGVMCDFMLHYMLPFIAYQMELAKVQEVTEVELEKLVNAAFNRFREPEFFSKFDFRKDIKRYRKHLNYLQVGDLPVIEQIARFESLMDNFDLALFPVTIQGQILSFSHQHFQTYFAARHLLNEIQYALEKEEIPALLKDQILPEHLGIALGQLANEHRNKPSQLPKGKAWKDFYTKTSLGFALDLCRGVFEQEAIGHCVWNILQIWKKLRGSFAGADFSNLQLSGFNFNGIECRKTIEDGQAIESKWDQSHMAPKQIFSAGHVAEVIKVRVSPDGKTLASASKDGVIKLWKLETMNLSMELGGVYKHKHKINTIAFSPDGSRLASGDSHGKLIEWAVDTGKCLRIYRGKKLCIEQLEYHPSGEIIMALYTEGYMGEWSTVEGKCLSWFAPCNYQIQCFAYIKNGHALLIAPKRKHKNAPPLMEISSRTKQKTIEYQQEGVIAIALSPSGQHFITLSDTGQQWEIKEWGIDMDEMDSLRRFTFIGQERPPKYRPDLLAYNTPEIAYCPTGEYILLVGLDDHIYEWALKNTTDTEVKVNQVFKGHVRRATSIAYLPEGKAFFSCSFDAAIKKWSNANGQAVHTFTPHWCPYNTLRILPQSHKMIACSEDSEIHILDSASLTVLQKIKSASAVYTTAYYTGSNRTEDRLITGGERGVIEIWDAALNNLSSFTGHRATVTSLALVAVEGQPPRIASADIEGKLLVWNLLTKEILNTYATEGSITKVIFGHFKNEECIIASDIKGAIKMWNPGSESDIPVHEIKTGTPVYSMAYKSGKLLTGGRDGKVKQWDENNEDAQLIHEAKGRPITHVSYTSEPGTIMVGTSMQLLKISTDEANPKGQNFKGHTHFIIDIAFDEDEKKLYSVAQDSSLKKWNFNSAKEEKSITNYMGLTVKGVDFSNVHWIEPLTDDQFEQLSAVGAVLYSKEEIIYDEKYEDAANEEKPQAMSAVLPPPPLPKELAK